MVKCMCYSNGIMLGINGIVYIYIYIYIIYINPSHICVVYLMSIESQLLCKNEKQIEREKQNDGGRQKEREREQT